MAQYAFGGGTLWGTPLLDAYGNAIVNPTPVQFGTLQDCSLDINFDTKLLYGSLQFPVAVGRGKGKCSGKAKIAQLNGLLLNELFFGQTGNPGIIGDVLDTVGMLIPVTPFTITSSTAAPTLTTFQMPTSALYAADLGVKNANGVALQRVATGPTTGQYTLSVSAGVATYVFATADAGTQVFISYQYTATNTSALTTPITNLTMGYAPSFRADLSLPYQGNILTFTMPNCVSSKMSFATKQDDFMVPEFDFEVFANAAGNLMTVSMSSK